MLKLIFPFLRWFRGYALQDLKIDTIAGITVALVLIPQSMAYAQLAGLPPYYGLYASFLPPMIAALFGSSRQLATGPVAVVSLMTAASLEPLATAGSEGYIAYAILLALMVGVFQFSLGVLRLGLVVNLLSHPVVNGFTNAAALIIASSQLSKIFGVHVDKAEHHYQTIIRVAESAAHFTHWPTVGMAVLAFGIMYGMKRLWPRAPNVLAAVVVTILLSWGLGFKHDATVDASKLKSRHALKLVDEYNRVTGRLKPLADQRTEVNKAIETAGQSHDIKALLDAEHEASILIHDIQRTREEAHRLRRAVRDLMFEGVERKGELVALYPQGKVPTGMKGDGRAWRIHVGSDPIDKTGIRVCGGGSVVGVVPGGLPTLSAPKVDLGVLLQLLPFAAIISLLGFMEAISIAKAMAAKTGQRLDPNQELIGQGLGNILGSFGMSYPTSGSFSRSAVNLQAGAVSGVSSVVTSLTVVVVLMFFTPLLFHLPQSVLAAVIMMAVIGLLNVSGFIHAWKAKWYDGAISIITFCATLVFAPHLDKGIFIGVLLSVGVFLYKNMRPTVASLARDREHAFRSVTDHDLSECKYVSMVRFDGPLIFANSSFLEAHITNLLRKKEGLKHLIVVANGINDIDASGEETLSLLVERVRSYGADISFSGVNEGVMKVFRDTHFLEKLGRDHIYPTMEQAVRAVHHETHRDADEECCPLLVYCGPTSSQEG
ncbi:MAG: SulP family inorganic anion transporter [Deltaproteobacteria bacterium]|nr:SulP family inorganic anion transporter [Deltaproteobacteria bacterium]